jgi:hypothetical protein
MYVAQQSTIYCYAKNLILSEKDSAIQLLQRYVPKTRLLYRRVIMEKKQLLTMIFGLAVCLLSQSLWAAQTCNADINITKPNSIYIDHLDGTVSDSETGLMWQKCSLGQTWDAGVDANSGSDDTCTGLAIRKSWNAALTAVQTVNGNTIYGYSDWRLPNKNELKSLVEKACYAPSINETLFPNFVSNYYWSSSPSALIGNIVWIVDFNVGIYLTNSKLNGSYVRLVRGGDSL